MNGRELRVTHAGKLYFSRQTKLSKLDLVRYYMAVAPGALAGIRDLIVWLSKRIVAVGVGLNNLLRERKRRGSGQ